MPCRLSSRSICSRNFLGIAWAREISAIICGCPPSRARQSTKSARSAYLAFCEIIAEEALSRSCRSGYSGNVAAPRPSALLFRRLGVVGGFGQRPAGEGSAGGGRGTAGRGRRGRRLGLLDRLGRQELGRQQGWDRGADGAGQGLL